jgi:isocitrate dehydrogenase kinase/phosphatase
MDVAQSILADYLNFIQGFKELTLKAAARFRKREWRKMQVDNMKRLKLYKEAVIKLSKHLLKKHPELAHLSFWKELKSTYHTLTQHRADREIAETYFNSIFRKCFPGHAVNAEAMFLEAESRPDKYSIEKPPVQVFEWNGQSKNLFRQILAAYPFNLAFEDLDRDLQFLKNSFEKQNHSSSTQKIEILKPVFYRNKAAYLIGRRLVAEDFSPFIIPLIYGKNGLYVDTLLQDPEDARVVFSYTRAYFMVKTDAPAGIVAFLRSIMPGKDLSEIYNSIGYHKHGKTEQYRDLLRHLAKSDDQFVEAPGVKGLVMTVFTLPSYNYVFKVIKDVFEPPKTTTRKDVIEKYRMVKHFDRVGRMADTHEYEVFMLPKSRISNALMEEFNNTIPSQFKVEGDYLIFKHLYTEKKSIPLNILLETAKTEQALKAALDYGQSIKEMAAANIFPGDMLTKNFGITRQGRCIFYDYDEIVLLIQCNFRDKPKAESFEQIYASSPWYEIGPNDIFPEEFKLFMIGREDIKAEFESVHGDIFRADYWKEIQQKIKKGEFLHAFPYPASLRFRPDAEA